MSPERIWSPSQFPPEAAPSLAAKLILEWRSRWQSYGDHVANSL